MDMHLGKIFFLSCKMYGVVLTNHNILNRISDFHLIIVVLARYMLSPVRLSVHQTGYHRKTVEVRIMKFSSYGGVGSHIPLVFVEYVTSGNSKGPPKRRRQTREGWVKSAVFYLYKREYLER